MAEPQQDRDRVPLASAGESDAPFVATTGIGKRFGNVVALEGIDFHASKGEVVALLGDNGAGKTTFIKILAGAHAPSSGQIVVRGTEQKFASPLDAAHVGIATIFQELALADNLSVYENVFLGREMTRRLLGLPILNRAAMQERVRELLDDLDAHIPSVHAPVSDLSGGQRQAVAIARALNLDAELFIMDEPTAALAVAETRKVLDLILQLRKAGKAVLLISHNMQDVMEVADRVVVLRRGRKVGERAIADTTREEIVGLITGAVA